MGGDIYGRLGQKFPKSGGPYVYLKEAFGAPLALSYGWISLLVISPTMVASYASFFSDQIKSLGSIQSWVALKLFAIGFAFAMTLINALGIRTASALERLVVSLQIIMISLLFAVLVSRPSFNLLAGSTVPEASWNFSLLAMAIAGILWSFEGFNSLSFIAHEIKENRRRLRASILWGIAVVFVIYTMVNVMALGTLDAAHLASTQSMTMDLALVAFHEPGAILASTMMLVAVTMSCLPATMIGPRVVYEMAYEGFIHKRFAQLGKRSTAPLWALWLQWILASLFILVGDFEWLIGSFVTVTWMSYIAVAIAFYILLRRDQCSRSARVLDFSQIMIFILLSLVIVALQFWRDFLFSVLGISLFVIVYGIMRKQWISETNGRRQPRL